MHQIVSNPVDSSRRWWVLAIVVAAQFMFGVDAFIVNVAIPTIAAELHASSAQIEAVVAVYLSRTYLWAAEPPAHWWDWGSGISDGFDLARAVRAVDADHRIRGEQRGVEVVEGGHGRGRRHADLGELGDVRGHRLGVAAGVAGDDEPRRADVQRLARTADGEL